jgi:hypothetical protein
MNLKDSHVYKKNNTAKYMTSSGHFVELLMPFRIKIMTE